jgi:hypothetical protein
MTQRLAIGVDIGGNISNAYPLFGENLENQLSLSRIKIEISELKESASMIGSAVLTDDNYYKQIKPLL